MQPNDEQEPKAIRAARNRWKYNTADVVEAYDKLRTLLHDVDSVVIAPMKQERDELRAKLAGVEQERDAAMKYALDLATSLFEKEYKHKRPEIPWHPLKDLAVVISQIDN